MLIAANECSADRQPIPTVLASLCWQQLWLLKFCNCGLSIYIEAFVSVTSLPYVNGERSLYTKRGPWMPDKLLCKPAEQEHVIGPH